MLSITVCTYFLVVSFVESDSKQYTVLAIHDDFTETQASPALKAAVNWLMSKNDFQVSFHVVTSIVTENETENDLRTRICDLILEANLSFRLPVLIFDTTRALNLTRSIKQLIRQINIPAIYTSSGHILSPNLVSNNENEFDIQVHPPEEILRQVIKDVCSWIQFSAVIILHDETFILDDLLVNTPYRHLVLKFNSDEEINRDLIYKFQNWSSIAMFAVGRTTFINSILKVANEYEMFDERKVWYILSKDYPMSTELFCDGPFCSVTELQIEIVNEEKLTELKNSFPEFLASNEQLEPLFYLEVAVTILTAVQEMILDQMSLNTSFVNTTCQKHVIKKNQRLKQLIDHESPYGTIHYSRENKYQQLQLKITQIEKNGNEQRKNQIGELEAHLYYGHQIKAQTKKFSTPVTVYNVVTFVAPPFVYKSNSSLLPFRGLCIDLLEELSRILNFKYKIYESNIPQINDNNRWYGVFSEISEKRADIIVAPVSVMSERENIVDFTIPFYDLVGISIMMRRFSQPSSLFKFLTVLETEVWACILIAYFFTSVLLWLLDRFSPYSSQNYITSNKNIKCNDKTRIFTLKESLWFCITSLTPQGGGEAPRSLSGRLMAATWWLFGFVIVASYTANLAAFLTVSRIDNTINDLDDLIKQHKIKFAPVNGSAAMTYFQRMAHIEHTFYEIWVSMSLNDSMSPQERANFSVWDYPVSDKFSKMWQMMKDFGLPQSLEEGLERTLNEDFALIAEASRIKYWTMTNCDLLVVGEEFSRKAYALAVQKNSPLKDQLSRGILEIQNDRKLEQYKDKWWSENPERKNCDVSNTYSTGISIQNIGGVFLVIVIGISLAFLTLIGEYFWFRVRPRKQNQVTTLTPRNFNTFRRHERTPITKIKPRAYYFHY